MIMIIAFVIWTIVSVCFLGIGIYTRNSKNAVGFWANAKPIEVTDVKKYNKALSKMWMVYAIEFEIFGLPLLFIKQNSPVVIVTILGVVFLTIGIMIMYTSIEGKYSK